MFFSWPNLLYPYYSLLLFLLSLFSVYRLVLWGWGLLTDRVYITLSQPCTADLFNYNNSHVLQVVTPKILLSISKYPTILMFVSPPIEGRSAVHR